MRKQLLVIIILIGIMIPAVSYSQDCVIGVTIGEVTLEPCAGSRANIPIYMNNPCTVGGFSIEIATTDPSWLSFNPTDTLVADTVGSRNSNWMSFSFQVAGPSHNRLTVTALGVGDDMLIPGDGLIFTIHPTFTGVSDTCQLMNFGNVSISDSSGLNLLPSIKVRNNFCVNACGSDLVRGDANSSGTLNGLDVTFLVAYFKGGTSYCVGCPCLADANSSGTVNGLDVVFLVSYFKGNGPAPGPCE